MMTDFMNSYKRLCLLFFCCFAISFTGTATSITNLSSGNWHNSAIWPGGILPANLDKVTVAAGTTIQVSTDNTFCDSLVVDGTLEIGEVDFTVGGRDLQIDNRAIRNTSCIINGHLRINGNWSKQFKVYGNVKFNLGSAFTMAAGKVFIDGAAFLPELSVPAHIPLLDVTDAAQFNYTGGLIIFFNPHYFAGGVCIKGAKHFYSVSFGNNLTLTNFAARTTNDFTLSDTDKPTIDVVALAYLPNPARANKVILNNLSIKLLNVFNGIVAGSGYLKIANDVFIEQVGTIERDIELNGTMEQKISSLSGNPSAIIKGNIVINNPTRVAAYVNLDVQNGTVHFAQGKFDLVDKTVSVSSPPVNANASSYFITKNNYSNNGTLLIKNLSGTTLFPVGIENEYLPVSLTTNSGDFSVSARPLSISPNSGLYSINYQWDISRVTGTNAADVKVQWTSNVENYNFAQSRQGCRLFRGESGNWYPVGSTYGVSSANGSVFTKNTQNVSNFTTFTMLAEPNIPVTLKSFSAKALLNAVVLRWETATELNNRGFDVEKSTDGTHFNAIGFVKGVGNSVALNVYAFTDVHFTQAAYYRLKQTDNDGTFVYSPIVSAQKNKSNGALTIYPNALTHQSFLTVDLGDKIDNDWDVSVFDIKGRMVFYGKQPKDKTATTIPVADLAKGFYVMRVINGAETQVAKFIKD